MSGVVGGVGSKSGNIRRTEIDHEYGSWTPALHDGSNALHTNKGEYIKMGYLVHIRCHLTYNTTYTNNGGIGGMPFTSGGSGAHIYACTMQNLNWDGGHQAVAMYHPNGNTVAYYNFFSDDVGWTSGYAAASGDINYFTGTYYINPPTGSGAFGN